jgi:putative hydrolase of the HAD superfamily
MWRRWPERGRYRDLVIQRDRPEALLLDLDGVLRRFDVDLPSAIERRHELPTGSLLASAFAWSLIRPALVGAETHAAWLESIVADLAPSAGGPQRVRFAVEEWQADRGAVAPEVLSLVRDVRAAGMPVGLATNATDQLDADLEKLGLTGEFDVVINSSVIGVPKPSREFFATACAAVHQPPQRCLFIDDDDRHVRGARVAGLLAYRWNGPLDLPYLRAALGL